MVIRREGNWCWFDHLNNQDKTILENTWYYSALTFAKKIALKLNNNSHIKFLDERINGIKNNFNNLFWKGKFYSSGEIVDDRANAMAVLTGLAKPEYYSWIKNVLITTFNASTYMEGYVCEALYIMGYKQDSFNRMMNRYMPLIQNENTTLWEDFSILGTKNHAWTGYPLNIFYKYIAGVRVDCEKGHIIVEPDFSIIKEQNYEINIADGMLKVNLKMSDDKISGKIINTTKYKLKGVVCSYECKG